MAMLSFDHIHYRYSNLGDILEFYVNIMGAIDLGSVELGGHPNRQLELGGATLLFADEATPLNPVTADEKLGVYHIAFLVDNCDVATEYYRCRGAVVAKPPKMYSDNIKASFLTAPDEMMLELKQIMVFK